MCERGRHRLYRKPVIRRDSGGTRRASTVTVVLDDTLQQQQLQQNSISDAGHSDEGDGSCSGAELKLKRRLTRAKLVQQKTLALYRKHLKAFCGCMEPRLFDRALIVRLVERNEFNTLPYGDIKCDYVPCIAYTYPEKNGESLDECCSSRTDCPDLFIPDFTRAKAFSGSDRWPGNEEFTLTLTDESGKRTFAYCVRHLIHQHEENGERATCSRNGDLPEVFAVISPIHAPQFYMALARECVCYLHESLDRLKSLLKAIYRRTFPTDGSSLCVLEKGKAGIKREIIIRGQGPILGQINCSAVVRRLGAEVTVAIIAALLAEQRVIIAGGSVQCVCHAIQSIACLLQPFSWPYTLIPVLPDSLLEIVNSPTPYLIGILRTNMYKLKALVVKDNNNQSADDLIQDDLVIVDLDGGIFVPQLTELYIASENIEYKARSAFALCQKLLLPRKLAVNLAAKLNEAVSVDDGPRADTVLQKAMLSWFAALMWPYKGCSFSAAFIAESNGDYEPLRAGKAKLVASHSSKSARRFTEWFVETGIFREWIRRKVVSSETATEISQIGEDVVNQKFDECVLAIVPQTSQTRMANIFSKAHNVIFRSHLLKKL